MTSRIDLRSSLENLVTLMNDNVKSLQKQNSNYGQPPRFSDVVFNSNQLNQLKSIYDQRYPVRRQSSESSTSSSSSRDRMNLKNYNGYIIRDNFNGPPFLKSGIINSSPAHLRKKVTFVEDQNYADAPAKNIRFNSNWWEAIGRCMKCNKKTTPLEAVRIGDRTWHTWCLKCEHCWTSLDNPSSVKLYQGDAFCNRCYASLMVTMKTSPWTTPYYLTNHSSHNFHTKPTLFGPKYFDQKYFGSRYFADNFYNWDKSSPFNIYENQDVMWEHFHYNGYNSQDTLNYKRHASSMLYENLNPYLADPYYPNALSYPGFTPPVHPLSHPLHPYYPPIIPIGLSKSGQPLPQSFGRPLPPPPFGRPMPPPPFGRPIPPPPFGRPIPPPPFGRPVPPPPIGRPIPPPPFGRPVPPISLGLPPPPLNRFSRALPPPPNSRPPPPIPSGRPALPPPPFSNTRPPPPPPSNARPHLPALSIPDKGNNTPSPDGKKRPSLAGIVAAKEALRSSIKSKIGGGSVNSSSSSSGNTGAAWGGFKKMKEKATEWQKVKARLNKLAVVEDFGGPSSQNHNYQNQEMLWKGAFNANNARQNSSNIKMKSVASANTFITKAQNASFTKAAVPKLSNAFRRPPSTPIEKGRKIPPPPRPQPTYRNPMTDHFRHEQLQYLDWMQDEDELHEYFNRYHIYVNQDMFWKHTPGNTSIDKNNVNTNVHNTNNHIRKTKSVHNNIPSSPFFNEKPTKRKIINQPVHNPAESLNAIAELRNKLISPFLKRDNHSDGDTSPKIVELDDESTPVLNIKQHQAKETDNTYQAVLADAEDSWMEEYGVPISREDDATKNWIEANTESAFVEKGYSKTNYEQHKNTFLEPNDKVEYKNKSESKLSFRGVGSLKRTIMRQTKKIAEERKRKQIEEDNDLVMRRNMLNQIEVPIDHTEDNEPLIRRNMKKNIEVPLDRNEDNKPVNRINMKKKVEVPLDRTEREYLDQAKKDTFKDEIKQMDVERNDYHLKKEERQIFENLDNMLQNEYTKRIQPSYSENTNNNNNNNATDETDETNMINESISNNLVDSNEKKVLEQNIEEQTKRLPFRNLKKEENNSDDNNAMVSIVGGQEQLIKKNVKPPPTNRPLQRSNTAAVSRMIEKGDRSYRKPTLKKGSTNTELYVKEKKSVSFVSPNIKRDTNITLEENNKVVIRQQKPNNFYELDDSMESHANEIVVNNTKTLVQENISNSNEVASIDKIQVDIPERVKDKSIIKLDSIKLSETKAAESGNLINSLDDFEKQPENNDLNHIPLVEDTTKDTVNNSASWDVNTDISDKTEGKSIQRSSSFNTSVKPIQRSSSFNTSMKSTNSDSSLPSIKGFHVTKQNRFYQKSLDDLREQEKDVTFKFVGKYKEGEKDKEDEEESSTNEDSLNDEVGRAFLDTPPLESSSFYDDIEKEEKADREDGLLKVDNRPIDNGLDTYSSLMASKANSKYSPFNSPLVVSSAKIISSISPSSSQRFTTDLVLMKKEAMDENDKMNTLKTRREDDAHLYRSFADPDNYILQSAQPSIAKDQQFKKSLLQKIKFWKK